MTATFVVEDGTGLADANSLCSVAVADQYHEDYGNTDWALKTLAEKQQALRLGTQAHEVRYGSRLRGSRVNEGQSLSWPRISVTRENFVVPSNVVPTETKYCVAVLARSSFTEVLVPDIAKPAAIKKKRTQTGPVVTEVEYVGGLQSEKQYSLADSLVSQFITSMGTLERG